MFSKFCCDGAAVVVGLDALLSSESSASASVFPGLPVALLDEPPPRGEDGVCDPDPDTEPDDSVPADLTPSQRLKLKEEVARDGMKRSETPISIADRLALTRPGVAVLDDIKTDVSMLLVREYGGGSPPEKKDFPSSWGVAEIMGVGRKMEVSRSRVMPGGGISMSPS